jgi:dTDP-4-amino-4,6-dideoxygalactose transaminase
MTLALLGGTPVRTAPYPSPNTIGEAERREVLEVLDSGLLSGFVATPTPEFYGGPKVRALERAFGERFGVRHAVMFNSATSALHACVAAAGVGPGDEVITSPYSMSASATCIVMQNGVPVFADIEDSTFCVSVDAVARAITPHTRAIVAVNIFGQPAALGELAALARRHGLVLIEDSAQAPGALHDGRPAGTIGALGVFSLNRHKTIQTGEGGVAVTNDDALARKLQLVRNHGEVVAADLGQEDLVNAIGWNYRPSELHAAVGVAQFRRLDELNAHRVKLADHLTARLGDFDFLAPPVVRAGCTHVYYLYSVRYFAERFGVGRETFLRALNAEGIPAKGGYVKPIYLEPMYQKRIAYGAKGCPFACPLYKGRVDYGEGSCPTVERLYRTELFTTNICRYPATIEDMDDFVAAVEKVWRERDALRAMEAAGPR